MQTNMIVNAARDGARFGATLAAAERNGDGCFTSTSTITTHVQDSLDAIGFEASDIEVIQGCSGTVPTIEVVVNGSLSRMFPFFFAEAGTDVVRSVTFADEGREDCTC